MISHFPIAYTHSNPSASIFSTSLFRVLALTPCWSWTPGAAELSYRRSYPRGALMWTACDVNIHNWDLVEVSQNFMLWNGSSGVAKGMGDIGACPPSPLKDRYAFNMSPASPPDPHRGSAPGPHWGLPPPSPPVLSPLSKFLATPLCLIGFQLFFVFLIFYDFTVKTNFQRA